MHALELATGGVLRTYYNEKWHQVPTICDGMTVNLRSNEKCYRLQLHDDDVGSFALPTEIGIMREKRMGAASISIWNSTTLWVTGGEFAGAKDSTEWINVSLSRENISDLPLLQRGVPLPKMMAFHCLEMINNNAAILYGGSEWIEGLPGLHETWTIDNLYDPEFRNAMNSAASEPQQHWWIPRTPMNNGRFLHSCGVIRVDASTKFVVAAGGQDLQYGVSTKTVELLRVQVEDEAVMNIDDIWEVGPLLPRALSRAASATTGNQAILFVVGGEVSSVPFVRSDAIFSLWCLITGSCWWTTEELELMMSRTNGIALLIPPASCIFAHQPTTN